MKSKPYVEVPQHKLDSAFFNVHKARIGASEFGLDNTEHLICGGFGLYSTAGLKPKIGPIKSEFFRVGFGVKGAVDLYCGLEQFHFTPGHMAFTFPGQIFSLQNKSSDFFAYYIFFTDDFIVDAVSLKNIREDFPFFNYSGIQSFEIGTKEAAEIQSLILKLNDEIKSAPADLKQMIQLLLQLILLQANRSYQKHENESSSKKNPHQSIVNQYKKLVSKYFNTKRKVSDYAELMHISPNYLNRVIKRETGKTAGVLIDDMVLLEAKTLLIHTNLSIAEIAYQLDFTDPPHFNKFFKKTVGFTPLQFRQS